MNDIGNRSGTADRVDLRRAADFWLGGLKVAPASCETFAGHKRIRLQPQVMKVLVALARARGEAVSREALIETCWDGLAVGDDAIGRCIQRLRRLSEGEASGAFTIETLPRIGYRLASLPTGGAESTREPAPRRARWRHLAAAVAGLATAAAAWAAWAAWPTHWAVVSSRRLGFAPECVRHPAISPDGTMLAYSAGATLSNRQIYVRRLAGGGPVRVTTDASDDSSPAWSRDGGRLAYVAFRAGEPCRVMVVSVPTGSPRELGSCAGAERARIAWARTGDALYVSGGAPGKPGSIGRMDLATGALRTVTDAPNGAEDQEPSPSPDGRSLAFIRTAAGAPGQAMVRDLVTGVERTIAIGPGPQSSGGIAWAQDSHTLFVAAGAGAEARLRAYPIGERGPVDLTPFPLAIGRLASGPHGLLAAEVWAHRLELWSVPVGRQAAPRLLDATDADSWGPRFSRRGDLALLSARSGTTGVWLVPRSQAARELIDLGQATSPGLAWSPDATRLAFPVSRAGALVLTVTSSTGRRLASIPAPVSQMGAPAWSNDGGSVLAPGRDRMGWRLWRADLRHGGPMRPAAGGEGCAAVRIENDAVYCAQAGGGVIWELGPVRRLVTDRLVVDQPEAWTVGQGRVVFYDARNDAALSVVSVRGGPVVPLARPRGEPDAGLAFDPVEGRLAFFRGPEVDQDLELFTLARVRSPPW